MGPAAGPPPATPPGAVPPAGSAPVRRRRRLTPLQTGLVVALGLAVAFLYRVIPLLIVGEGEPTGPPTPLTSAEVCGLLAPGDLEAAYDQDATAGEPSPFVALGRCRWTVGSGEDALTVEARVGDPRILGLAIGADRPASEYAEAAFDALARDDDPAVPDDGAWDEAVFQSVDDDGGYADRLILRTGDDVLQFEVTAAEEPTGGRDGLARIAAVAAASLAEQD